MNCPQIHDLLAHAIDEPLGAAERVEVDAHLTTCPACVRWVSERVLTVEVLRGLGRTEEQELSPPVPAHLARRVLAARTEATAQRKGGRKSG